jgi:hypothetical protein
VKVGDLVKVLPARISYYIIIESWQNDQRYGTPQWILHSLEDAVRIIMSEPWIEVINEH